MLRPLVAVLLAGTVTVAAAQRAGVPPQLRCTGNEPSWAVQAGPDSARLTRLAAAPEVEDFRGGLSHLAFLDPPWALWRGASPRDRRRTLVVAIRKELCRDTMADGPPFEYRAVVSFPDGSAATGCCRATPDDGPRKATSAPPKSRSAAN